MAETAIAVQNVSESSALLAFDDVDTTNNNKVANRSGDVVLVVTNPGASSATLTVTAQNTSFNIPGYGVLAKSDKVVTVNAGETHVVGPFPAVPWNDASGDLILTAGGAGAVDLDVAPIRMG